jgi:predicted signal transduction protein with EAL and GGDEF domain
LLHCVRDSDTVSRQGGDEFVILLVNVTGRESVAVTADKVIAALKAPYTIGTNELRSTTSIGISLYPADGPDAETLIKCADIAMYHAKEKGRDNYQFYESAMNARIVERGFIESGVRSALQNCQLSLHYQPKVNLQTGAITGAEALLRWNHPEMGDVSPARFIPIAEESGLIISIGRWVLREACTQAKRWMDQGLPLGSIAVNISALELRQQNLVANVRDVLTETGLRPDALQLEITESVLMHDADLNCTVLNELKSLGIALAADDFGTGYSSLSYLTQFPIDVLKIDRAFVGDIETAPRAGLIAEAVIGMGNSLRMKVVAEGVETEVQLAFLKNLLCEEGQGHFFSRPLSVDRFGALLKTGIQRAAA